NVGELGYAFRDLPWKTLDFFSDKSADAGLLDVFSVNDDADLVAGHINMNTYQSALTKSALIYAILAKAGWEELDSTKTVVADPDSVAADSAVIMTSQIFNNGVGANPALPYLNRSELITRPALPTAILPTASKQVKAQREAVPRAFASVSQTRTWNLMIDVIAQSWRYPPTASGLADFVVEGEKRYW